MKFISHRINSIISASNILNDGIEVDVRYHNNELICHHDPFNHHTQKPDLLIDVLRAYKGNGPVILNIKTEGIEEKCIELMGTFNHLDWFFLDLSMPYFVKFSLLADSKRYSNFSPSNLAVRFSEYEPSQYALSFQNKAKWLWVDCFRNWPIKEIQKEELDQKFKICLVSPELQGHPVDYIPIWKKKLGTLDIAAVCTKRTDLWA